MQVLLDSAKGALQASHTSAYWHAAQLVMELGLLPFSRSLGPSSTRSGTPWRRAAALLSGAACSSLHRHAFPSGQGA